MEKSYILLTMINDQESHIIGEVLAENDEEVVLFRPLTLKVHYDTNARTIRTWVRETMNFSIDKRIHFVKNALASYTGPTQELVELYKSYMENDAQFLFEQVEQNLLDAASLNNTNEDELLSADIPIGVTKH
jgi:hypothetical protein